MTASFMTASFMTASLSRPRNSSMSRLGVASTLIALCGVCGCGGGGVPAAGPDPTLPPTGAALTSLPSATGALQVSVWTSPQPPIKGVLDAVYQVTDAAGLPVDGLGIEVVPWMPAHGHGTSATAVVEPEGNGFYLVKPVYLYMSGRWELRTTLGDAASGQGGVGTGDNGSTADSVVPIVDVP